MIEVLKNNILVIAAFFGLGALMFGLGYLMRWILIALKLAKEVRGDADKRQVELTGQPIDVNATVKKQNPRFNYPFWENRHNDIIKQLDDHELRLTEAERRQTCLEVKMESNKTEILKAGEDRKDELQKQINELPDRIVANLVNAQRLTQGGKQS